MHFFLSSLGYPGVCTVASQPLCSGTKGWPWCRPEPAAARAPWSCHEEHAWCHCRLSLLLTMPLVPPLCHLPALFPPVPLSPPVPTIPLSPQCPALPQPPELTWLQSAIAAGTAMWVWFLLLEWQGGRMEGRESTGGVGGGWTWRARDGAKSASRRKGRSCERWAQSRRTAVVGRNWSIKIPLPIAWGGGGWNPTGNGTSVFVTRVRGIINGDFLWNKKRKADLLQIKQGRLGCMTIPSSSSPYRSVSRDEFILGNISNTKNKSSKITTLALHS